MKFWTQFGLLLVVVGVSLLAMALASVPGQYLAGNGFAALGFHWIQWMQTLFVMILAPLCWYRWYHLPSLHEKKASWMDCFREAKMTTIDRRFLFLTFCLSLAALPALDSFEVFMNRLPWPDSIHDYIMQGFRQNQIVIGILLSPTGVAACIEQFVLMCLCTAIGEELMFRGALFSCLRNLTRMNIHVIAWLVGFVFALIHFEPAGFVVRMALGAFFVYLVHWSGSLWPSVLAHCMNNSYALIGYKTSSPEELANPTFEYTFGPILTVISVLATVALMYVLWQMRVKCSENEE